MTNRSACAYWRTRANPLRGMSKVNRLTAREKEVLLLLGTGLGNRQLARELHIAERTVKAHIARIVEKLGQETRLQAAVLSVLVHNTLCDDVRCSCRYAATAEELPPAFAV
ncbi:response regulator transcription factor [Streptomyces gibsoniae]|uniref:Helix-turn-helix transcriptional regulator n=1 Tax=Streptomyces gibsoniae TaxID=3075529 RepID=A0ABU2TY43_9ACTN|nr:helix-turn-helix transcriptional regulator [Streptomyces sp. DSM 41699]MDT0465805.1 helix-turn-helix transcriptional regulator [Streptomyces sp. DSM 41699]